MNNMYSFKPYPVCVGRVFRKVPQLYRPMAIMFESCLCNEYLTEKNKIRFLKQLFRWFYKSTSGFKVIPFLKYGEECKITEGDIIYLSCRSKNAGWKKLMSRLNYRLIDYKKLKRRKSTLFFTFFFTDIESKNKEIWLDLKCSKREIYKIFIVSNLYYEKDFMQLLFYFYIHINKYL